MARVWYDSTIVPSRYIVNPVDVVVKTDSNSVATGALAHRILFLAAFQERIALVQ